MKKLKVILLSCVLVAAAAAGWMAAQSGQQETTASEEIPRITLKTDFVLTYHYAMCGHEETEDKDRFIGMNRDELEEALVNGSVGEFSAEKVSARKLLRAYCPRNEIVRLEDGAVCDVSMVKGSCDQRIKRELGISEDRVDPDYIELLKKGMVATLGRSVQQIADMICGS